MSDTLKAIRSKVEGLLVHVHCGMSPEMAEAFETHNFAIREVLALLSEAEAPRGRCAVCDTSAWDCSLMSGKCCSECRHPNIAPPVAAAPAPPQTCATCRFSFGVDRECSQPDIVAHNSRGICLPVGFGCTLHEPTPAAGDAGEPR